MRGYIGWCEGTNSAETGRGCALRARQGLPAGVRPGWAIAFCGGRLEPAVTFAALRQALGGVPVIGGAAVGAITRERSSYSGFECAVAVFPNSAPKPILLVEGDLREGERETGRRLGARVRAATGGKAAPVLLLYDSVKSAPPPTLHPGSEILDGLYDGLEGSEVHLFGGGTISDFNLHASFVFDGHRVARHVAVAAILPDFVGVRTTILHGCMPSSGFLEVTGVAGAAITALNGRPALDVLEEILGYRIDAGNAGALSLEVTLGEKQGDPFAAYDESAYVSRLIVRADAETRALVLFEPDFKVGSRVQFMTRDNQHMLASVRRRVGAVMEELEGEDCLLALYIDCAGRTRSFSGSQVEEAAVLIDHCRPEIPLLGFYSGVEIAPLMGRSRPLDWTGVLSVLYAR